MTAGYSVPVIDEILKNYVRQIALILLDVIQRHQKSSKRIQKHSKDTPTILQSMSNVLQSMSKCIQFQALILF
jgi:hypothetical protein